jgi:hypothetical protein
MICRGSNQEFSEEKFAGSFMMHILVSDFDARWRKI